MNIQIPKEKAPGACDTEGFDTNTNTLDFATVTDNSKAVATQIAELALAGHTVHQLLGGDFMVCKYRYCYYAQDFDALRVFARELGVSK